MNNILPFSIGQVSTSTALEPLLGANYKVGARLYRLVKATAAITTPARRGVVTAYASGIPSWSVDIPTAQAILPPAGIIPIEYGSTTIALGSYFYVQIDGPASALAAATAILAGTAGAALFINTSGNVALFTAATDAMIVAAVNIGYASASVGAVAVGSPLAIVLEGLGDA